jgi:hypothetical protein
MKQSELLKLALGLLSSGKLADRLPKSREGDALELHKLAKDWLQQEGIQGFGIARRITAGVTQPERVLKVYVDRKLPRAELGKALIPAEITIPTLGISVPIDVEAIGRISAQNFQRHERPLFRGLSVGLKQGEGGGTLGCFVRKHGDAHNTYLLSNSHVLEDPGTGEVYQPAVRFGGDSPDHVVADFTEAVPIAFDDDRFVNRVDAAIAKLRPGVEIRPSLTKGASGRFREGTEVFLKGASSGQKVGIIKDTNFEAVIGYSNPVRKARFRNQVLCSGFSSDGDSGSTVLHAHNHKVLGLLVGGGPGASVFTPIQFVLEELGLELVIADDAQVPEPVLFPPAGQPTVSAEMARWEKALKAADSAGCKPLTHQPGGVAASHELAEADFERAKALMDRFQQAGTESDIPVAVLAAIASRESRVGMPGILDANGLGDNGNGFGIMQVDKRHHAVTGLADPRGLVHIRQATSIFANFLAQVRAKHPGWSDANVLKGAMAAYNFGVKNVQTIEHMDVGTTHNDYSSDVTARAKFYQAKGLTV